jgi:hypothetical protein
MVEGVTLEGDTLEGDMRNIKDRQGIWMREQRRNKTRWLLISGGVNANLNVMLLGEGLYEQGVGINARLANKGNVVVD